jgi:hypothetical protein
MTRRKQRCKADQRLRADTFARLLSSCDLSNGRTQAGNCDFVFDYATGMHVIEGQFDSLDER